MWGLFIWCTHCFILTERGSENYVKRVAEFMVDSRMIDPHRIQIRPLY